MSILIDDAFIAAFQAGSFGLPIAYENEDYEPTGQTAYAEIFMLPNPTTPLNITHSNVTTGLFRIILRYPTGDGATVAKAKAEAIVAAFPIESFVSAGGQSARITQVHRDRGFPEEGWYKTVITITYEAFIAR